MMDKIIDDLAGEPRTVEVNPMNSSFRLALEQIMLELIVDIKIDVDCDSPSRTRGRSDLLRHVASIYRIYRDMEE